MLREIIAEQSTEWNNRATDLFKVINEMPSVKRISDLPSAMSGGALSYVDKYLVASVFNRLEDLY